ncbi:hypothetical protein NDU88_003177 [Pleurodeles waltl]|uniref:Uncharacterized protein n=1 Tax=Pleurodeles waltl TaxID=8319 RepID=A0AAV7UZE4_PLEWA|nr:hypothetical protein NDU88_003177 [Pleurodeles waltl]
MSLRTGPTLPLDRRRVSRGRGTRPGDVKNPQANRHVNCYSQKRSNKHIASTSAGQATAQKPNPPSTMADGDQPATMERILQEITAVSRSIEGMDASISSLTLETKSIWADIAGFHSRVMGLEHRVGTLEIHMSTTQDRDQDLFYLRSKVTDLEDRSRRDNIRLFGIPENEEGTDVQAFLSSVIPKLTSLAFEPPLEFQQAHRVGPKRQDRALRPRPIIACLLRHSQIRQILQVAQTHGPFLMDKLEVRITATTPKIPQNAGRSSYPYDLDSVNWR